MKHLGRWPTNITLLGTGGANSGEKVSYRTQIMGALRARFKAHSTKPIQFRSTRTLKVFAHALCPTRDTQGKLIYNVDDAPNMARHIASFLPANSEQTSQDKEAWQEEILSNHSQ